MISKGTHLMKNQRGFFITFEGGEGAGKTTQINLVSDYLTQNGYEVITTREPGGTPEAEKIRKLLVTSDGGNWSPEAEILLFFTARVMHLRDLILPALEQGKIVICDRFTDSTRAYQSYGRGYDPEKIETIKKLVMGDLEPDLTIIFDIDPEIGIKRSLDRNGSDAQSEVRFEKADMDFHKRMREGYLKIAKTFPDRCKVINASIQQENILDSIIKILDINLRKDKNK